MIIIKFNYCNDMFNILALILTLTSYFQIFSCTNLECSPTALHNVRLVCNIIPHVFHKIRLTLDHLLQIAIPLSLNDTTALFPPETQPNRVGRCGLI